MITSPVLLRQLEFRVATRDRRELELEILWKHNTGMCTYAKYLGAPKDSENKIFAISHSYTSRSKRLNYRALSAYKLRSLDHCKCSF